ncbi:MAG: hypothetical protein KDC66_13385 [Phaeodactylibacter sp.]|nr:hypothetical protein [Phaeodactylibacter sp.]MCB9276723.1 hypothetical protein [Lewinellaceae bacterium]
MPLSFISEQHIEEAAMGLNASETALEQAMAAFQEQQPILFSYFFTENFQAFTEEEKEYILYLVLVIWEAFRRAGAPGTKATEQQLAAAEEYNWGLMEQSRAKDFHQRLGLFFQGYPQEDLLAFVEDALAEDEEDDIVTPEGREAIFISLKTAIDCLAGITLQG